MLVLSLKEDHVQKIRAVRVCLFGSTEGVGLERKLFGADRGERACLARECREY